MNLTDFSRFCTKFVHGQIGHGFQNRIYAGRFKLGPSPLLWRLHHDLDHSRREQRERTTLRIVGGCFIALAAYILYESGSTLMRGEHPEGSVRGIAIAALSLVVMPMLARAKRRVAAVIGSGVMQADSRQTDFCAYISAILLGGLLLNALLAW
jgi:hypothetical protein